MSFITKRERVFNDYDVFDLPNRNEGKLKAYSSCTDARAWSHFGSDKTEHLVEIIKKNNCVCRPKYVPTETIIDTLMVSKNAKITALQRKIEEFEEMMTAYDELDLTCEQKCEIAKAHAAIKEANKDLHGLFFNLDLDVSQFTEGSEGFATGKSRGDEGDQHVEDLAPKSKESDQMGKKELEENEGNIEKPHKESIMVDESNQVIIAAGQSAGTMAIDPRIQEMEEIIVAKEAKMAAMTNTMAVMENDVCEPYCIYAHIYTALEKIFATLCQNDKYKLYLNMMTCGRDTRCVDIRGKILFKLKVLEKFSLALISPCAQETKPNDNCTCYRAEFKSRVEATFALTSAESMRPRQDNQRAQLVADIMENDEMREILSKENSFVKTDHDIDEYEIEDYNIGEENLKRLKNLQENYDDLMTCYENLKHEKNCLQNRCFKYDELQKEFEALKDQLREYSLLWNEKEHYRRRSVDLDSLKEQYLVLSDETSNIELQLKAEAEINKIKSKTIEELRQDNLSLEQKVNEASMVFEREKNALHCKLKEAECKTMCQDQQIRSLSVQIDSLLEQGPEKEHREGDTLELQDEINKLNEQITNLKAVCICNDEGKQQVQEEFQTNLINSLKMEIEELKSGCEEILQRNDFLEKNAEIYKNEINKLDQNVKEKSKALENLMDVLQQKSHEVNRLMSDVEQRNKENGELYNQVQNLQETYTRSLTAMDTEKTHAIKQLHLANKESQELIKMVNSYENIAIKQDELESSFQAKVSEYNNLKLLLTESQSQNLKLQKDVHSRDSNHSILLHESKMLKEKLEMFGNVSDEFERLKKSHEKLEREKKQLEIMLGNKSAELKDALYSIEINKQGSEELLDKLQSSENLKLEFSKLNDAYGKILKEKHTLQNDFDNLLKSFNKQSLGAEDLNRELMEMKATYNKILSEKNILQADFDNQADQYNILYNNLENKIDENKDLMRRLSNFENVHKAATSNIASLIEENYSTKSNLTALKKESAELLEKVKYYELLESEYNRLKDEHDRICVEKNKLQRELDHQVSDFKKIERDNLDLSRQSNELLSHSEILEKALINARAELLDKSNYPDSSHAEIISEIEEMRKEKTKQHKKINELLDKLDESENEFSKLYEIIGARDDKIAVLQNHINALQDEVRKLQTNLEAVVETGEQISDNSSQKLSESLLSIDAHHSRATHNMKMELAKLQSINSIHEENEEAMKRDKKIYSYKINELLHEREIIVTDIKQLEIRSVGDSTLSPNRCEVEDVLTSLERIGKILDVKCSKSNVLEQTLLTVQNSYQLVQTKTDEAKKIVEKEKQKIISEKEEAIKDKINMEKQLQNLNDKLKQQKIRDDNIIKDLEAEILNQKLITDKVTQSTQCFISKLEDDLKSLQALYQNSLQTIGDLENKLKSEQSHNLAVTQKISKDLENKIQEVEHLNKILNEVKKGPAENIGIQTMATTSHSVENQTNDHIDYNVSDKKKSKDKYDNLSENKEIYVGPVHKNRDKASTLKTDNNKEEVNEVQVLTASIEPSFDFVRNSYLDYKLKRLRQGGIDICSISSHSNTNLNTRYEDSSTNKDDNLSPRDQGLQSSSKTDSKSQSLKVINLYKSAHTDSSSKGNELDKEFNENEKITENIKSVNKTGAYTSSNRSNHHSFATISKTKNKYKNSEHYGSTSGGSTDRDLFVIYKDSESSPDKSYENKRNWNGKSEIVVEAVTIQNTKDKNEIKIQSTSNKLGRKHESDPFISEEEEYEEDDSVKHKLKISLPRAGTDSQSNEVSDVDKKSLDSYSMALYSSPKTYASSNDYKDGSHAKTYIENNRTNSSNSISRAEQQYTNTISVKKGNMEILGYKTDVNQNENNRSSDQSHYRKQLTGSDSHHKLSRVEADVLLLKPEDDLISVLHSNVSNEQNYGLNYILDSHKYPDNIKTYIAAKGLRKTRSDDRVFSSSERSKDPSRSELKKSSTDNKTISICSKSSPKSYTERSIMVNLGSAEEYENKIQALTRTLENIEKDYKKRIDAIKTQYDSNIKSILNEHNQGVESIQNLHEETLQDILKIHENEVENLRTMSIEAMRKADKLEKENKSLKNKFGDSCSCLDEEPTKITTPELKRKRRRGVESKTLTKTNIEAFNVKPTNKLNSPCTCTLDLNISDTIRNIFEQVDVEQRKLAEQSYVKFIANKILSGSVDVLDTQELSFLHLKVCRIWKTKLTKEESLQKRIDSLEAELLCKQKNTQQNIAELDRKVAEERRRLQEVREAVCRTTLTAEQVLTCHDPPAVVAPSTAERDFIGCSTGLNTCEQNSTLELAHIPSGLRQKRTRNEINRAVLAKLDAEDRREKKIYTDEMPTRLRKSHDRDRSNRLKK